MTTPTRPTPEEIANHYWRPGSEIHKAGLAAVREAYALGAASRTSPEAPRTLEEVTRPAVVNGTPRAISQAVRDAYALGLAAGRASPEEGRAEERKVAYEFVRRITREAFGSEVRAKNTADEYLAEAQRCAALRSPPAPTETREPRCDCCGHPPHDDRAACGHLEPLWDEGKCHCAGSTHRPHRQRSPAPPAEDEGAREARLEAALRALLRRDERNTCQHEETRRGGAIWTICDGCGAKWADDRGGKPEWKDPPEWIAAHGVLAPASSKEGGRHE